MSEQQPSKINRISLKSLTINQIGLLAEQIKEMGDRDYQVLLLTPYGFIKGDLLENASMEKVITSDPDQANQASIDLSAFTSMRAEHVNELKEENPDLEIVDNGATLNLKNVEVYKDQISDPVLTLSQMLVFANEVIGVSLIPRDHLQN